MAAPISHFAPPIFAQGDAADSVFYIKTGKVKVTVVYKHGKEGVVAILGTDEFVGEGCLIGQPKRLATAAQHLRTGYTYDAEVAWDVRNRMTGDSNLFHGTATDRIYKIGDYVARGTSGVSYRGYPGDLDRGWSLGSPSPEVIRFYQIAWECNQAMAEMIKPGNRCSDIYAACAEVERGSRTPPAT
jgi:Metallopeptidase family M24/Cyclic nucleotide-binding domain